MSGELFQDDPYLKECDAVVRSVSAKKRSFVLNRTIFYPMGGGQPGDTGCARGCDGHEFVIQDTQREPTAGLIHHHVDERSQLPKVGAELRMAIDWKRRYRLMRMHSCLHLLCAVVPGSVTGAQVYDGKGRLDFDTSEPYDKIQLTHSLNLMIQQKAERIDLSYSSSELSENRKLLNSLSVPVPQIEGRIRLVHFHGIDIQPCGGTHVANTEEIGRVRVTKIESKGRRNRRITVMLDN